MFLKKDLVNGMVVEFNDGHRRLVWNDRLIDSHGYIPMSYINDKLINIDHIHKEYIARIYLTHDIGYLTDFFNDKNLSCIWENK